MLNLTSRIVIFVIFLKFHSTKGEQLRTKNETFCDNGKKEIMKDMEEFLNEKFANFSFNYDDDTHVEIMDYDDAVRPEAVCMDSNITYPVGEVPNRGKHRPIGGKLGEYGYLPPSRYITNLIGGAVVFAYHPALPDDVIGQLRMAAHRSTNKYVITSSRYLNETFPIAVLLYRQVYMTSSLRSQANLSSWICENGGKLLPRNVTTPPLPLLYDYDLRNESVSVAVTSPMNEWANSYCPLRKGESSNAQLLITATGNDDGGKKNGKASGMKKTFWAFIIAIIVMITLVLFAFLPLEIYKWKRKNSETSMLWNDQSQNSAFNIAALVRRPLSNPPSTGRFGRFFAVKKNRTTSQYTLIRDGFTSSTEEDEDAC